MDREQLFAQIQKKKSFLCVGLDTDILKIPACLQKEEDPVFAFNRQIIDATAPYAVAYKPNIAFYECMGIAGWQALEKTIAYIRSRYPDMFVIADAKRGDIGNTSAMYARCFFEQLDVDALTVAPYMGQDSVTPFLKYPGKWVILLALTSNKGSEDFQLGEDLQHEKLFEKVLRVSQTWADEDSMMYVVGATHADVLKRVRELAPRHFLLVPGIGSQGGSLEDVCRYGLNDQCGLLVNASRSIIYAGSDEDFAQKAAQAAKEVQVKMYQKMLEMSLIS